MHAVGSVRERETGADDRQRLAEDLILALEPRRALAGVGLLGAVGALRSWRRLLGVLAGADAEVEVPLGEVVEGHAPKHVADAFPLRLRNAHRVEEPPESRIFVETAAR